MLLFPTLPAQGVLGVLGLGQMRRAQGSVQGSVCGTPTPSIAHPLWWSGPQCRSRKQAHQTNAGRALMWRQEAAWAAPRARSLPTHPWWWRAGSQCSVPPSRPCAWQMLRQPPLRRGRTPRQGPRTPWTPRRPWPHCGSKGSSSVSRGSGPSYSDPLVVGAEG